MKKLTIYFIALFLVPTVLFTSCKDTKPIEPNADPAFKVLTDYMKSNNLDLPSIIKYHGETDIKFVVPAPATSDEVDAFLAKYHIIDIRSAADYAAGHVDGAINTAPTDDGDLTGALTEAANAGDKPILVVCYTGQVACFTTALLRLAGYRNTQALKWGMSGWNSTLDKWTPNIGDVADGHNNWTTDATAPVTFSDPEISSSLTGKALLDDRINKVLKAGFKGKSASDIIDTPDNYCINNYFSGTDYAGYGHIKGAYRINPLTLENKEYKNLDASKDVITYCYTGQTSGVLTAYLRVLGYNAYSLKFGLNGLFNSSSFWTGPNQWGVTANPKDYPLVTK